jgi:hypothetical protein
MTSKYFLFQIGCLRLNKSLDEVTEADRSVVLQRCVNLHLHHAMESIDTDDDQIIAAADNEIQKHGYISGDDDEYTAEEIAFVYASRVAGVKHPEKRLPVNLKALQRSQAEITTGFSRVAFPRKLFWEAIANWNFREFAVLCAVWSAIGQASYRRVTFDKIIRGSLGFGTEAEFLKLPKKVEPLSRMQVRYAVEKLEERGFFHRCPMNRRHTAYTKRLSRRELIDAIARRQEKKQRLSQRELLLEVEKAKAKVQK